MKKLILLLVLLVSLTFSADYKPFTFDNIPNNDSVQQAEWDILMKYKAFGAYSFKKKSCHLALITLNLKFKLFLRFILAIIMLLIQYAQLYAKLHLAFLD